MAVRQNPPRRIVPWMPAIQTTSLDNRQQSGRNLPGIPRTLLNPCNNCGTRLAEGEKRALGIPPPQTDSDPSNRGPRDRLRRSPTLDFLSHPRVQLHDGGQRGGEMSLVRADGARRRFR